MKKINENTENTNTNEEMNFSELFENMLNNYKNDIENEENTKKDMNCYCEVNRYNYILNR